MEAVVDQSIEASESEQTSPGWQEHLQTISEEAKEKLARALHDDLGALLVGAMMDLAWAEQNWDNKPGEIRAKIMRARQSLAAAIDYKRRLVENLRPSLLENVGLFAALRWHVKATCQQTGLECQIDLPATELHLAPKAAIVLFRVVQEAYALFCEAPQGIANLIGRTDQRCLEIQIIGSHLTRPERNMTGPDYKLTTIRQRVSSLGGKSTMQHPSASTMTFRASVPLRNILTRSSSDEHGSVGTNDTATERTE
jgi:signal transduction histidine kinase